MSHHAVQNTQNLPRSIESPRAHAWRSESVLYIFIDTWLRYDVEDNRDLPNNEFIRCVRILVKQLHAFGNSADIDTSSMCVLRQVSQSLMNARIYTFLKSVISRWPLLSSFSDVLELYLSYIQPWRYTFNRDLSNFTDVPITQRFEQFIQDNLIIYTQIFILLLPRFDRLDLTTLKNITMLFRLLKVFSQTNLIPLIQINENLFSINNVGKAQINQIELFAPTRLQSSSPIKNNLKKSSNCSGGTDVNTSSDLNNEWKMFNKSFDTPNISTNEDDTYIFMFSDGVRDKVQSLMRKLMISKLKATEDLQTFENEYQKKYSGIRKYLAWFWTDTDPSYINNVNDRQRIPEILDYSIRVMSRMFDIYQDENELRYNENELIAEIIQTRPNFGQHEENEVDSILDDFTETRSYLDNSSLNLSPTAVSIFFSICFMKNNFQKLKFANSYQIKYLVPYSCRIIL